MSDCPTDDDIRAAAMANPERARALLTWLLTSADDEPIPYALVESQGWEQRAGAAGYVVPPLADPDPDGGE